MEAESPTAIDWRQIDGLRAHDALGERWRRNEKCRGNLLRVSWTDGPSSAKWLRCKTHGPRNSGGSGYDSTLMMIGPSDEDSESNCPAETK